MRLSRRLPIRNRRPAIRTSFSPQIFVMTLPDRKKIAREDLKPGEVLVRVLYGQVLPVLRPADRDADRHSRISSTSVGICCTIGRRFSPKTKIWYLLVHTKCKHLRDDNLCGIYETRPQICRDYSTEACEYEDDWTYERYFETPEQIYEYAEAILQKPGQDIRSPQPAVLPHRRAEHGRVA